jgi:hypothetical protein
MKTFYSILYCPIIPEVNENISVGLYLKGDKEFLFRYSKAKLGLIRNMVDKEAFNLLQMNLKSIERSLNKLKKQIRESKNTFLPIEETDILSESYFGYLSRYSKNFLSFSKPSAIKVEVNQVVFKKLFQRFVYRNEFLVKEDVSKQDKIHTTKINLKSKTENKLNWDFEVTDEYVPELLFPVKTDFIGKNHHHVSGSFIDFNKSVPQLKNDLAKQFALIRPIKKEDINSKCFILSNEPSKELKEQHNIWHKVYASDLIEYLDLNEYEKVMEHIEDQDVKPLFEFEE